MFFDQLPPPRIPFHLFLSVFHVPYVRRMRNSISHYLLSTAYVVEGKVMFWLVSVHLSVHTRGGVTRPGLGGGYPSRVQLGGTRLGGTQPQVPPFQTWLGGTPPWLHPLPIGPSWGYLIVVLDTPRSVCLLRSRRRTFLYLYIWTNPIHWKSRLDQISKNTHVQHVAPVFHFINNTGVLRQL